MSWLRRRLSSSQPAFQKSHHPRSYVDGLGNHHSHLPFLGTTSKRRVLPETSLPRQTTHRRSHGYLHHRRRTCLSIHRCLRLALSHRCYSRSLLLPHSSARNHLHSRVVPQPALTIRRVHALLPAALCLSVCASCSNRRCAATSLISS